MDLTTLTKHVALLEAAATEFTWWRAARAVAILYMVADAENAGKPVTMTEIRNRMGLKSSAEGNRFVTGYMEKQQHLLKRGVDPTDERKNPLYLTARGRKILGKLIKATGAAA